MPLCGAVTWSVLILLIPGFFSDDWGDALVGTSTIISVGVFWLAAICILAVRRRRMGRLDWLFLKYGVPVTCVISYVVFRVVALFMK